MEVKALVKPRAYEMQGILGIFGLESLCLIYFFLKYEKYSIHNYNFACRFMWMWNLISHITEEHRLSVHHFIVQRMHTTLKNVELLTHSLP